LLFNKKKKVSGEADTSKILKGLRRAEPGADRVRGAEAGQELSGGRLRGNAASFRRVDFSPAQTACGVK